MQNQQSGILALADGAIFTGISVGAEGQVCGEVVFNTAQMGYQEILTDPSYAEQIIVFTEPHIGNVGVNPFDNESDAMHVKGAIMRSFSATTHHWQATHTLADYLIQKNIIALSEVDTRALTLHLRAFGAQSACLMTGEIDAEKAVQCAKKFPGIVGKDLVREVTTKKIYHWKNADSSSYHVVIYDFGMKQSILHCLKERGCTITVVPAATPAEDVLALHPDGILLSNGPGDPAACAYAITAIKTLLKTGIPIMAICLGHQLLALASGATTKKMIFGHHGANHPVQALKNGSVFISSQNHGFVVAEENLPNCLRITHRSLFDGSIAGIERIDVPAFGFQGHPEAGPGPTELRLLFDHFITFFEVAPCQSELI